MSKYSFQSRIEASAKKHGFVVRWEQLRFNTRRAVVDSDTWADHDRAHAWAKRMRGVSVSDWTAVSPYAFTGRVYIMDQAEYDELHAKIQAENDAANAWNERFHAAAELVGTGNAGEIASSTSSVEEAAQAALRYKTEYAINN